MGNTDCNECIVSKLVDKLTERVAKIEQDYVTTRDYEWMKEAITEIKASIKDIATEIKGIKDKPSQRWELIITTIIAVVVSSGVTFFISKIVG